MYIKEAWRLVKRLQGGFGGWTFISLSHKSLSVSSSGQSQKLHND